MIFFTLDFLKIVLSNAIKNITIRSLYYYLLIFTLISEIIEIITDIYSFQFCNKVHSLLNTMYFKLKLRKRAILLQIIKIGELIDKTKKYLIKRILRA